MLLTAHLDQLDELARRGRRRRLASPEGLDFSSNDYLALGGAPELRTAMVGALARGVPIGSGGSRLLRGNHPEHEALEREAADLFGARAMLFFGSGYAANATLFATLPQRGDLVLHDELIHASTHDGLRLGRAEWLAVRHNDAVAFEAAIRNWRRAGGTGRIWIAVESLYSMDGDFAPLADLAALAHAHDAFLIVDEAHATGVFGPDGRGLCDLDGEEQVIVLRTCGKALGCEGALLSCDPVLRDFLVNRGRGFIFSTAPSPLMAAAVRAALGLLRDQPQRRERLLRLMDHAAERLSPLGVNATGSQIMPLILGDEARTMAAAAALQKAGVDVRGIRPPTVPVGSARLRIAITLHVDEKAIDLLADELARVLG